MADKRYSKIPLSFNRKAVMASVSATSRKSAIHLMTEVDVTVPRARMSDYKRTHGEKLSFTGYVVTCLARTIAKHPEFNSFIRGNSVIQLDDLTIGVLVERQSENESVPEPYPLRNASEKDLLTITRELREAAKPKEGSLGALSGMGWFRLVPGFLLSLFIRLADRSIRMAGRYGKVSVTAIGMFGTEPFWAIPHGPATVLLTVGSIVKRILEVDGGYESREHLCLTASFDHNLIDGAPAARFMNELVAEIKSGDAITSLTRPGSNDERTGA